MKKECDLYTQYLHTIKGLSFTPREIDVIACFTNMRGGNKVASLLSIAPTTVITHSRNVMQKIGCNSREGIIDFIEHAGVDKYIRVHYLGLRQTKLFEEALRSMGKVIRHASPTTLMLQALSPELADFLGGCFQKGGIPCSVRMGQPSTGIEGVYCMIQEPTKGSNVPKKQCIEIGDETDFMRIAVKALQHMFARDEVNTIAEKFDTEQSRLQSESEESLGKCPPIVVTADSESPSDPRKLSPWKGKPLLNGFVAVVILLLGWGVWRQYDLSAPQGNTVRSDLVLPIHSQLLIREDILRKIDSKFMDSETIQTVALTGIGGVGKTTLARMYAHQHSSGITWSISADSEENILESWEGLAESLAKSEGHELQLKEIQGIEDATKRTRKLLGFVRAGLKGHPGWFLIFDNVEDFENIQAFFPQDPKTWGRGRILLTTPNKNIVSNFRVNHAVHIRELSPQEKQTLFESILFDGGEMPRTPHAREETRAFLEGVPPYPLDVCLAAYYIKTTHTNYGNYLEKLSKGLRHFEVVKQGLLASSGEYVKTRYSIVVLSIRKVLKGKEVFSNLLLLLGVVNSQEIPRAMLDSLFLSEALVDELIYHLKQYSLISEGGASRDATPLFSIHRSTQSILLEYLQDRFALDAKSPMVQRLGEGFSQYLSQVIEGEDGLALRRAVLHATKLVNHEDLFAGVLAGKLMAKIGALHYHLGDRGKSIAWLEKSLGLLAPFKNQGTDYAWALAYLGDSYREKGDYEKGKVLLEQSAALYNAQFPENPKDVAWALTRLSNVYRRMGQLKEAEQLLERVLGIYVKHAPEAQTKAAWAKTYLANVYNQLGKYAQAKAMLEEALKVQREAFGEKSLRIAWVLSFLGDVHHQLEAYEEARTIFHQSLSIYETVYGKEHQENARILLSLGKTYGKQGELEKGEAYLQRSLKILEEIAHPDQYHTLQALGELRTQKAERAKEKGQETEYEAHLSEAAAHFEKAEGIRQAHFNVSTP